MEFSIQGSFSRWRWNQFTSHIFIKHFKDWKSSVQASSSMEILFLKSRLNIALFGIFLIVHYSVVQATFFSLFFIYMRSDNKISRLLLENILLINNYFTKLIAFNELIFVNPNNASYKFPTAQSSVGSWFLSENWKPLSLLLSLLLHR